MSLHDIELDRAYSYRSVVSEEGKTAIVEIAESGAEQRNEVWTAPRIRVNLAQALKTWDDQMAIQEFRRCRGFRAHSWRFWHPLLFSTNPLNAPSNVTTVDATATDEVIGTGDGSTKTFQLIKTFVSGAITRTRTINLPIAGTVKVAINGSESDATALVWSVNLSTGIVTFTTAPANGDAITAGCQFDIEMRFESDETSISLDGHDNGSIPEGLGAIEVRDNVIVEDELYYGGSSNQPLDADTDLTPQMGKLVRVTPSANGFEAILPDPQGYEQGGPYWKLRNMSGSHTFLVTYAGSTVATVQVAGDANRRDEAEVWICDDGSGGVEWEVFS